MDRQNLRVDNILRYPNSFVQIILDILLSSQILLNAPTEPIDPKLMPMFLNMRIKISNCVLKYIFRVLA